MEKKQPKYSELVNFIRKQIAVEKFTPGEKIYSENQLREMFHVSRQTIRHAISILEEEGVLESIRGSGTYVSCRRNNADRTRISVVTTYVDSYIFPRTIQGIENVLSERGFSVQIAFTNNRISRERSILKDILVKDEVAGVIIETTKSGLPNPNLFLYEKLRKKGIPVLFINSYYPQLSIPHVSLNDRMAGRKAAEHLIEMGHNKIGGIFKLDDGQGHMRYAGYLDAMDTAGMEIDDSRIMWVDTDMMERPEEWKELLQSRVKDCTGLVCYNDQIALAAMEILSRSGLKIPEDISLVSIDDSELAVLGEVQLSSIPHPTVRLGEKAAENLLAMILDPGFDGTYEFEATVIKRNSVYYFAVDKKD